MAGDYLLDTNIVIAYFNGEGDVLERILDAPICHVSVITLGELSYGAQGSRLQMENLQKVLRLEEWATVLDIDKTTSQHYGRIKHELRTLGRPIPENDLWIAALARQHQLTLVSRDDHFVRVPDVKVEMW
jgi:tRNA(fMet)-specific endonuclease VapC